MTTTPTAGRSDDLLAPLFVVELGDRMAAGACGSLLAHLGATVALVEPPRVPSGSKWQNRPVIAAGKQSIVIDRETPEGRRTLQALIDRADVVLLSSDRCRWQCALWSGERPRRQIVCDLTAYGHSGPLAGLADSEALVQARAAIADTMGPRDGLPALIGVPLLDMETAVYAASAVVAALRVRSRHGIGQRIDMALYDVAVNAILTFIPLHLTDRPALRNGNRHPTLSPWNAYQARDGWVLVCGPTNAQWQRICEAIDAPHAATDPLFATTTARLENVERVDDLLGSWIARTTVQACVDRLAAFAIPSGSIVTIEALAEERNLKHRGAIQLLHDPLSHETVHVPASPFRTLGHEPAALSVPAPDAHRALLMNRLERPVAQDRVAGDPVCTHRPLENVRVVEIGMNTVAPLACRQLGALGADVIKVEPPTGDTNRWNAPLREDGESYVFALSNTDKRGLVLDLKDRADKDTLFRLLASADMVIENLKPGSLSRLGVGAEDVLHRFPNLIYCSVSGFGHDSAYPGRPALDTVIQGMSGVMSASTLGGVPTKAGISVSDQLGGQFAMLAMLAALIRRESTGEGARFDLAMQDVSAWATQAVWNGRRHPIPPCRILATRDGAVALEGDAGTLVTAVGGVPAISSLTELVRKLSRDELLARLSAADGCAAAPVLNVADVLDHPQTVARGLLVDRPTPDGSRWLVLESPLRLLSTPAAVLRAMPRLGVLDNDLARELALRDTSPMTTPTTEHQRTLT